MPRASVRSHTRRVPGVGTVAVQRHNRKHKAAAAAAKKDSSLVAARRVGRNLKRAYRAMRRRKKIVAAVCLTVGVTELAAWLGLRGLTAAVVMVGVATFVLGVGAARGVRASRPNHPGWANGGEQ